MSSLAAFSEMPFALIARYLPIVSAQSLFATCRAARQQRPRPAPVRHCPAGYRAIGLACDWATILAALHHGPPLDLEAVCLGLLEAASKGNRPRHLELAALLLPRIQPLSRKVKAAAHAACLGSTGIDTAALLGLGVTPKLALAVEAHCTAWVRQQLTKQEVEELLLDCCDFSTTEPPAELLGLLCGPTALYTPQPHEPEGALRTCCVRGWAQAAAVLWPVVKLQITPSEADELLRDTTDTRIYTMMLKDMQQSDRDNLDKAEHLACALLRAAREHCAELIPLTHCVKPATINAAGLIAAEVSNVPMFTHCAASPHFTDFEGALQVAKHPTIVELCLPHLNSEQILAAACVRGDVELLRECRAAELTADDWAAAAKTRDLDFFLLLVSWYRPRPEALQQVATCRLTTPAIRAAANTCSSSSGSSSGGSDNE